MPSNLKTYRCSNNHEYTDIGPWEVRLKHGADEAVSSGPLCPYCQLEWLKTSFPTQEIDVPDKPSTIVMWNPGEVTKNRRKKGANA